MLRKLLCSAALLLPTTLPAQWAQMPNGEYGYTMSYSTVGTFACVTVQISGATCTTNANAITVGNQGATVTIGFAGATGSFVATNIRQGGAVMGSFNVSYGGVGAFLWPDLSVNHHLFDFNLAVTETGPAPGGAILHQGYVWASPTVATFGCCENATDYIALPITAPPPPLRYGSVVLDNFTRPSFVVGGPTTTVVTAAFGVVPEPATFALVGLGMLAVGAVSRRKR